MFSIDAVTLLLILVHDRLTVRVLDRSLAVRLGPKELLELLSLFKNVLLLKRSGESFCPGCKVSITSKKLPDGGLETTFVLGFYTNCGCHIAHVTYWDLCALREEVEAVVGKELFYRWAGEKAPTSKRSVGRG